MTPRRGRVAAFKGRSDHTPKNKKHNHLQGESHMKANPVIRARYWLFLIPLVLLLTCIAGNAQQNSTITGTVLDKAGAVVAGAEVTLTQQQTGYVSKTTSNDSGNFTFNG